MTIRRRRAGLLAVLLAVVLIAVLVPVLTGGGARGPLVPGGGGAGGTIDPLAFDPGETAALERRAAAGLSHVLYAKSPGGVVATARRTARFRGAIERAAEHGPIGADTLEAMVFLESAGRPDAVAGSDPSAAAGLTQIVAETGRDLLGMHIDLAKSRADARAIARAQAKGKRAKVARLRARRRRDDARFDPRRALAATERYLALAKRTFGRDDLAIASYHMGIGNLQTALRDYGGGKDVSYVRLFFDSTPLHHARADGFLASLGDDSRTYLWRVRAAEAIMRLYRRDPRALARQAALQTATDSAAQALRPPASTPAFADGGAVHAARAGGELVPVRLRRAGMRAPAGAVLRPLALGVAREIAAGVRAIAHTRAPLRMVAATVPRDALLSGPGDGTPLHATGYAFDILRRYASGAQAQAFQFMLDRLQAFDAIAWAPHGRLIHVVVGPDAGRIT